MLEGNRFAHLIPGNAPATGGSNFKAAPPKIPTPDSALDEEAKRLEIEIKRKKLAEETAEDNSPEAVKLREGESNAAFLVTNMLTSANSLSKAVKADPTAANPTLGQEAAGLLGETARNWMQPAQRQIAYGAQRVMIDNMLTLATGLTYTPEQIDTYTRSYFPQLYDTDEAIADKRNKLKGAMVAARIKAGKAAPQIDQAMATLGLDPNVSFDPATVADLPGFGDEKPRTGNMLTTTDDPSQLEVTLDMRSDEKRATELSPDERRAEAYRAKQDRFNPRLNPQETLTVHGMSGTLSDEAAGVGKFLSNALTLQDPIEGYRTGRDAERLRIEDARQQLGGWGTALEMGGGLLSVNPLQAMARSPNALAAFTQGAKGGWAGGTIYGFGSGEGAQDSIEKGVTMGAFGGLTGGVLGTVGNRMAAGGGGGGPEQKMVDAVRQEKLQVPNIMMSPTKGAINKAGRLEADPASAPVIQRAFEETNEAIGGKVTALGQGGNVRERADAGEMIRQAAKDIQEADKKAATAAYTAAEAIDGDPAIALNSMKAKLDDEIARLQRTPGTNSETIRELKKYRKDIEGPLPLSAVRDMRTNLRDNVNGDLTRSSGKKRADRRMLSVIEGTNDDIERGLSKEAYKAWKDADELYAGQMQFVKEALVPFVGKDFDQLPAEAIFDRLKAAANSNGRALATLHRRLTPDQSRDIAATFAESLGKAGPDDPFSAARFISQARKMSNSARQTIFGPSGADSFNNLLRVSRRLEQVKGEINRSKTARPVIAAVRQRMNVIIGTLLTGGGAMAGGPVGGGIGLVTAGGMAAASGISRALSAKALMNPRVSKLLLDGQDISSVWQMQRWIERLRVISQREPALTAELEPLHQALSKQIMPTRLAASDTEAEQ